VRRRAELFAVLRSAGLESRPSLPIARVLEKRATIYVDIKACWAQPSWTEHPREENA